MTASKQIAAVVIILVAVAVGWLGYQRGWYGSSPSAPTAGAQQATGGQAANGAGGQRQGGGGFGGRGAPVQVVTDKVETDNSGIEVRAVGTVAAAKAVTLYPQVTGIVTDVAFVQGSDVKEGDALLRLDDADQQVAVDKAKLDVQTAQAAYDRATQLAQSNNATAVAVTDAKTALAQAQISLRSAQLDLAKRTVTAPFAGTIGLTDISIGDLVTSSKAIASLDDMSTVTVSFAVPERASGLVTTNDEVTGSTDALAGKSFTGHITAVDSRVDPTTRTLNVQASLPNDADALKPGMALTIDLKFPGTAHPSVSSLAIQWDRNGSYVWKVVGGKAKRTSIQIIARHSGVVTVAGDLSEGDAVVTEGVLRVRDGLAVAEAGSGGANGGPGQGNGQRPTAGADKPASTGTAAAASAAAGG